MLLAECIEVKTTENSSEWLASVAKHHRYFISVVKGFGEDKYAEDIVQEMYLRIYKYTNPEKIIKDGEVNQGFIWFVLRNIYVDYCKQKGKIEKVVMNDAIDIKDEPTIEADKAKNNIELKIYLEIDSWHWYDTMLFKLYKENNHSMRQLSALTKISVTSIFHTIKHCKQRLIDNVGEDYEDYLNGDYERI